MAKKIEDIALDPKSGRDEKGRFVVNHSWHLLRTNFSNNGRHRTYETPEDLMDKALEYFDWAHETQKGKFATAHLRLFLGIGRTCFHNYSKRPEFAAVCGALMDVFEGDAEQKLNWAGSVQGAIFRLKNLHDWKDESTQNQNVTSYTADFGGSNEQEG